MHADEIARCETVEEISLLVVVVQQLGRRLENQSHGYRYPPARELNELLHQVRHKLAQIKAESPGVVQDIEHQERQLLTPHWPRSF